MAICFIKDFMDYFSDSSSCRQNFTDRLVFKYPDLLSAINSAENILRNFISQVVSEKRCTMAGDETFN